MMCLCYVGSVKDTQTNQAAAKQFEDEELRSLKMAKSIQQVCSSDVIIVALMITPLISCCRDV